MDLCTVHRANTSSPLPHQRMHPSGSLRKGDRQGRTGQDRDVPLSGGDG